MQQAAPDQSVALHEASEPGNVGIAATRTHRDENFPVASWLLAPEMRGPVLAFYRFVREADDIADSPDLSAETKIRRLNAMEAALDAGNEAVPAAAALAAVGATRGCGPAEARAMLDAFRQDAVKQRYADWDELVSYCERSANPVGRFLLRLHGESEAANGPADALCTALQILNHLQDLNPDRARMDRVYVPLPWLDEAGGEAVFFSPKPVSERRAVLDAVLDRIDALVAQADGLVPQLAQRRFAAQSAVTVALARRLAAKLRTADPILGRVALTKADFAGAFAAGLARAADPRPRDAALTRAAVARSGSSFGLGMASLSGERRRAIHAVYAYCRAIDDIADGSAPLPEKRRALAAWRREVDGLSEDSPTPVGRELARACARFALPRAELHALLDGMETDAEPRVRITDDAALDLYCRRVAGAVGVLSVHIFGAPKAHEFAVGLGRTLQLVNILRDVDEDAAIERVYVPLSRLGPEAADEPALAIAARPDIAAACAHLASEAARGFEEADRMLLSLDRRRLRPAILMMAAYRMVFARLGANGWQQRPPRPRLGRADKLRLILVALGGKAPAPEAPSFTSSPG